VLFQLSDLHVAIPALVLVVGQHDVPGDLLAEARMALELAFRNPSCAWPGKGTTGQERSRAGFNSYNAMRTATDSRA
jgi:hypothetical protein